MLAQFGNNWIQKIPLTAKLDSACGLVQFWLSSEFVSSNYFQIGQHVVLLHILVIAVCPRRVLAQRRKTRGGTLGFPACMHIRNFKNVKM